MDTGISSVTHLGAASRGATEAAGSGDVGLARSFEEELGRGNAAGGTKRSSAAAGHADTDGRP